MTRSGKVLLTLAVVGGLGIVSVAVAYAAQHYVGRGSQQPVCAAVGKTVHTVRIEHGIVTPGTTEAHRCDTLTIINSDAIERRLAFGVHSHHATYDNTTEKTVGRGGALTVTLTQAGTFMFHDHYDDKVRGHFVVAE